MGHPDSLSPSIGSLLDRYAGLVRQVGWRHGLSEGDVDEVMQDVRIRLWRSVGTSEKISSLSASYIHKTASSAAVDLIRRRRARREHLMNQDPVEPAPQLVASEDPAGRLEGSEMSAHISRAVGSLAEGRGAVVRMYLAGYGRLEIADLLGWTEAKTRNLLYRGLADLRIKLTALGIGLGATE